MTLTEYQAAARRTQNRKLDGEQMTHHALFGRAILDVMSAILGKRTFNYIKLPGKYHAYIAVCHILDQRDMIDWGSSIRGAWFDYDAGCGKRKALGDIPFTEENVREILRIYEPIENRGDNE